MADVGHVLEVQWPRLAAEDGGPMIPEAAIEAMLRRYHGWHYAPERDGVRDCRYPTPIPGPVRTKRPPPEQTDCVCFVEGVVLGAAWSEGILVDWSRERHAEAMVARDSGPIALRPDRFGPVTALVAAGLADEWHDLDSPPIGWAVCQGWSAGWSAGHAFICRTVIHSETTVHECALAARGVRTKSRYWDAVRRSFPHLAVARLLVG